MIESKFRAAALDDISKLLELEQKIIDSERPFDALIKNDDATYYDLNDLITNPDSHLVVVDLRGDIVGSGYAQIRLSKSSHQHDKHCYLGFIYLEPEHRGKGLSRALINVLKEWGLGRGIQHFQLDVYAKNESAVRAYEKAGFSPILGNNEAGCMKHIVEFLSNSEVAGD